MFANCPFFGTSSLVLSCPVERTPPDLTDVLVKRPSAAPVYVYYSVFPLNPTVVVQEPSTIIGSRAVRRLKM